MKLKQALLNRRTSSDGLGGLAVASADSAVAASHGYGGHTKYVYAEKEEDECPTGLNPFLALLPAVALAGGAFLIFNYVTTNGKKKRSALVDGESVFADFIRGLVGKGRIKEQKITGR